MAKAFKLALILDVSPGLSTNFEEFEEIFDCMWHVDFGLVDADGTALWFKAKCRTERITSMDTYVLKLWG